MAVAFILTSDTVGPTEAAVLGNILVGVCLVAR
ncbi:hypothetical protein PtrM4_126050 [Pyrenophora tritici-repentis]|uniref:Uncharacterized protein n=1 Tax=Pyrenophora tritici-repentis TaxID=45151 RepID=A0A834RU77_9PLEO|nr:hypothetical protein PtrM4_126050 [Pyrenophora tritici-repentis]